MMKVATVAQPASLYTEMDQLNVSVRPPSRPTHRRASLMRADYSISCPGTLPRRTAKQPTHPMLQAPRTAGFTLIELMVTVVVVAILAAIAIPSYRSYILRGRVPEALAHLSTKRVRMEQFFQDNRTYEGAPAGDLDERSSQYFDFSAIGPGGETRTRTGYVLYARGKGGMSGFTFSVDQSNSKASTVTGVSGWAGNAGCWITRPGGAC
jgi:type IV pilus assembly protein PilE